MMSFHRALCLFPDRHPPQAGAGKHARAHVGTSTIPGCSGTGACGNRLNVLLSWGGWRTDSWADRVACLLEPMGVNSLKACTARQAERVIRSTPVHIAVVDLGLPLDESGEGEEAGARILELLRRMHAPPPTVIVSSPASQRAQSRDMAAALRADAFAVVDRRSANVEFMLKVLQRALERFYEGRWPVSPAPGIQSSLPPSAADGRQRGPLSHWFSH